MNARFTSGNWFTNLFRRKTMDRFKDALQTQYNNWVTDSAKATAAGFKNNQNITAVKDAVNKCFDIIYEASGKLDKNPMNVSHAYCATGTEVPSRHQTTQLKNEVLTSNRDLTFVSLALCGSK